mmetsp:Transcript_14372/g.43720  ORF Transcript_14372/g.43720 Transcript_14372/m.43720 type:complete len:94 (+) Transcript_14372:1160-1441(+)
MGDVLIHACLPALGPSGSHLPEYSTISPPNSDALLDHVHAAAGSYFDINDQDQQTTTRIPHERYCQGHEALTEIYDESTVIDAAGRVTYGICR